MHYSHTAMSSLLLLPEFLDSSFKSHAANPTPVLKSLQPRDVDEIAQVLPVVVEWFMIVASGII